MKVNKQFFTFFEGFDLQEVAICVLKLSKKEKNTILSIWGENQTAIYNEKAKEIIIKIKRQLGKKSLMERLKCYDKNKINRFLLSLSEIDKNNLLKEYYVDDPKPKELLNNGIINSNNILLSHVVMENNELKVKYKSFFYYFKNHEEEKIIKILSFLNEYERMLIYKKYGKNLLNTNYNKLLTSEENGIIKIVIIPKIKNLLNRINNRLLFIVKIDNFYPNIPKDLLLMRLSYLNKEDQDKFLSIFGENLDREVLVSSTLYKYLINEKIKRIIEDNTIMYPKTVIMSENENIVQEKNDLDFKYKTIKRFTSMKRYQILSDIYNECTALALLTILYLDEEINEDEFYEIFKKSKEEMYDLIKNDERITAGLSYKRYDKILKK